MIRDQASKTLDLYIQRIKKYSSTMPDTALPSSPGPLAEGITKDTARIGTPNDNSWAGWAISSFTNKITTANGEIQPTANGNRLVESDTARPASVPRPTKSSSPAPQLNAAKQTLLRPAAHLNRSVSEQPAPVTKVEEEEPDDVFEAWGAIDDDDNGEEERALKDDDPFSPAPNTKPSSPGLSTTSKPNATPYDDGGEPDFAGWLAAQSKAKSKKPLPKGLNKPTTTPSTAAASSRTAATGTTSKPKTVVTPAKKIDTTPKDEDEDDGWGDAWD